ncbi:MAG: type VI secretion system accessory protein TagJ, partial [Planctomycetota bacterium]
MSSEELLKAGKLAEALARLQEEVRGDPADVKLRVYLFQLLAALGQWDRALTQLNVVAETDPSSLLVATMYRPALQSEALRAEIFAGKRSPIIFGEPEEWMAWIVQACQMEGQGQLKEAQDLRAKALEVAPATPGKIDEHPFEWIADADTRMGPMIEAIVNGSLYWVPFTRVRQIQIEEPTDLRDMIWIPATIVWTNGGEAF